jgi:hypothetical protein
LNCLIVPLSRSDRCYTLGDAALRGTGVVIMESARNVMLAAASAMLIALVGCSTTRNTPASPRNTLADSASALDRNAQALASHSDTMTPALQQDAHQLAESTLQFHSVVGVDGTDNASARAAFESVSRNYQKVSEDVNQLGTVNARSDLQPVTEAYQDVEHALR